MKKLIINKKVVKIYDSVDEMPIVNFQKYNKYLLIDSGIGSDADDIDTHITRIAKFIKTNNSKKALQELQNMRQNMYMVNSQISPKYLAFAALIHSIDGKKIEDLSDDSLKHTLDELKQVKHSAIIDFMLWLKKKLNSELSIYFPKFFDYSAKEKNIYDKLKQRTLYVLDELIYDEDNSERIRGADDYIFGLYKPKNFNGTDSVEITYDKQFEFSCVLISQKTNLNAKSMTVLEFYTTLENIINQIETENKAYKRPKRY